MFAGLPGITGRSDAYQSSLGGYFSGAFLGSQLLSAENRAIGSLNTYDMIVKFDASESNPIYGGSPTVQPRSYGVLPCVYLGS